MLSGTNSHLSLKSSCSSPKCGYVLSEWNNLLIDYDNLCEDITNLTNLRNSEQTETESGGDTLIHRMVQQLYRQEGRTSRQFRYDDPVLEHFALMAWILAGRRWYEIPRWNMGRGGSCAEKHSANSQIRINTAIHALIVYGGSHQFICCEKWATKLFFFKVFCKFPN